MTSRRCGAGRVGRVLLEEGRSRIGALSQVGMGGLVVEVAVAHWVRSYRGGVAVVTGS